MRADFFTDLNESIQDKTDQYANVSLLEIRFEVDWGKDLAWVVVEGAGAFYNVVADTSSGTVQAAVKHSDFSYPDLVNAVANAVLKAVRGGEA